MDGSGGLPAVGFDRQAFWCEAESVLGRGTRDMIANMGDRRSLEAAYDRMDEALGELVARASPPQSARDGLMEEVVGRVRLVANVMKSNHVDARAYWEPDMRQVAMIILKALGKTEGIFRAERIVENAADALCEGNFSKDAATKLIAGLSTYRCASLGSLLAHIDDRPAHIDFLRRLEAGGTAKAAMMAKRAMDRMAPKHPVEDGKAAFAKVIRMPVPAAAPRQPLRQG
jgi:hypothetical protein